MLGSLKILKLSHCYQFPCLGGFHELPLLEMLLFKNCMNLTNVCESIQNYDGTYPYPNIRDMDTCRIHNATKNGIPRDLQFLAIYLPRLLAILSLAYNKLSIETFPMDLSFLSMLDDLYLDGNPLISMPNCLRSLPRLEFHCMCDCETLMSIQQSKSDYNLAYGRTHYTSIHHHFKVLHLLLVFVWRWKTYYLVLTFSHRLCLSPI
ncbi:toll/interleukin-1 receptor (TIR) domain-containing protein [Artemisia annua]|uniref:Toll/interleukin-1 receptor (TIR) domain-containing protein n=1 Tax=Artemisia annua TaxID=35608 RepID=A0A2U1PUB0_ARTAN|nr:toll/interleukin-1 receptor (TIR) domain-containing protein [Artemisia annua]